MAVPTKAIGQLLYYFGDVCTISIWKRNCPDSDFFPEVTTQQWRLQRGAVQANYGPGEIVRSEDFLRQLDIMAKDPRFSHLSALDLQNILTAIQLCDLGFGSAQKVCQGLNEVLRDEWPDGGRRTP